jgi:hypothetical protein
MNIIHVIVFIHNWGNNAELMNFLRNNSFVISIFHIMGRRSYLIDANFDNKSQMEEWIGKVKSIKLPSDVPAIISIESQKIIDVYKSKEDYSLNDYLKLKDGYHFFVKIDNPHHDEGLIELLRKDPIVQSVLHIQGECSFISEVITDNYDNYKNLLKKMKDIESVNHIETHEVISVIKYRNQIIDEKGNLTFPREDLREIYSL